MVLSYIHSIGVLMSLFFQRIFLFSLSFCCEKVIGRCFAAENASHLLEFSPKAENVLLTENDARKKYIHA